jgi:hypothetical protein
MIICIGWKEIGSLPHTPKPTAPIPLSAKKKAWNLGAPYLRIAFRSCQCLLGRHSHISEHVVALNHRQHCYASTQNMRVTLTTISLHRSTWWHWLWAASYIIQSHQRWYSLLLSVKKKICSYSIHWYRYHTFPRDNKNKLWTKYLWARRPPRRDVCVWHASFRHWTKKHFSSPSAYPGNAYCRTSSERPVWQIVFLTHSLFGLLFSLTSSHDNFCARGVSLEPVWMCLAEHGKNAFVFSPPKNIWRTF